jgi:hypothetical protein
MDPLATVEIVRGGRYSKVPKMNTLWLVPDNGEPIQVTGDKALVGRAPKLDVVVNDPSVSRMHAAIEKDAEGSWLVSDQASVNGTWIDGQRIIKAALRAGQVVRFGGVNFRVSPEKPGPRARPTLAPQPPKPLDPPKAEDGPTLRNPAIKGPMTPAHASELLGVELGAPRHEIRKRYQALHNDFQIRITNAPTAPLKRMYQRNLQDLKIACEVLAPGVLEANGA